jgi:hypothetical protein
MGESCPTPCLTSTGEADRKFMYRVPSDDAIKEFWDDTGDCRLRIRTTSGKTVSREVEKMTLYYLLALIKTNNIGII